VDKDLSPSSGTLIRDDRQMPAHRWPLLDHRDRGYDPVGHTIILGISDSYCIGAHRGLWAINLEAGGEAGQQHSQRVSFGAQKRRELSGVDLLIVNAGTG
jgi:hypothetical protein